MDNTCSNDIAQSQTKTDASPIESGGGEGEFVKLLSGGLLIYTPPNMQQAKRRPMVVLGKFRGGAPALHFRTYDQKRPGQYRITGDGMSLTMREFWQHVVPRLDDLCEERPELVAYEQEEPKR